MGSNKKESFLFVVDYSYSAARFQAHRAEGVDGKRLSFLVFVLGARLDKVHSVIRFKCKFFSHQLDQELLKELLGAETTGLRGRGQNAQIGYEFNVWETGSAL